MNRLVAAALMNVGDISSYRNRWIADYDWLEIIKHAYSIPQTRKIDIAILNGSLARNDKFKLATSEGQPNFIGIFKDTISPRVLPNGQPNHRRRIVCCYRFSNPDEGSANDEEPRRWYDFIESKVAITDETMNYVTNDEKKKLQDVLPNSVLAESPPAPPIAQKRRNDEISSPCMAGLQAMKPRLAKRLHGDAKSTKGIQLNWADDHKGLKPKPSVKTIKDWARQIEIVLHLAAAEGTETAANVLLDLLERQSLQLVTSKVVAKLLTSEYITTNEIIVHGIKEFLQCHKSSGRREKEEQDAVDAVMVASCFSTKIGTINFATIAAALGISKYDRVSDAKEKVRVIKKEQNSKFKVYKTKRRSDYY